MREDFDCRLNLAIGSIISDRLIARKTERYQYKVNASGRFSYPPRTAVTLISSKFFVRKTWYEHCTRKYNVRVPRGKIETIRPELPRMASLKNVHPCTFFSFEFSWWKTRYCLEPLTSCQYSDVLCAHKTRLQLLYTDVQQLKMVQMVSQSQFFRDFYLFCLMRFPLCWKKDRE